MRVFKETASKYMVTLLVVTFKLYILFFIIKMYQSNSKYILIIKIENEITAT